MTEARMALIELLEKADDGDFLRAVAEAVLQLLMEADVESVIGDDLANTPPAHALSRRGLVDNVKGFPVIRSRRSCMPSPRARSIWPSYGVRLGWARAPAARGDAARPAR
jgi:hypothetical protein